METIDIIISSICALIALFFVVLIIRAFTNKHNIETIDKKSITFDNEKEQIEHFRAALKIPTISMVEEFKDNTKPFLDYRKFLEETYPLLNKKAERIIVDNYSIIYHLKGSDSSLKAGVYLAHQDVVPAPVDGWEYDPFSAHLTEDGYIYARGAQDMKSHMIALLEAVEYHLKNGMIFKRDLYLCFGHDEEPGAPINGAYHIAHYLKDHNIDVEFVVDEGGTVLDGTMFGISHTVALVGAAEKGHGNIEIIARKPGGHASNPKNPTADAILADAIYRIETHPMKTRLTPLTITTFKELSKYCANKGVGSAFKVALTNIDILKPLMKKVFTIASPMTNALVRTTFASTMLWGAKARNVIPKEAKANINFRTITGQTTQDVIKHLEKVLKKYIKKGYIEIKVYDTCEPTQEADCNCSSYENLRKSILQTFDDIVVAPYMFIAASDARNYSILTDNVFRFGPFISSLDDQARIHGINERLHKDQLIKATEFFVTCLDNTLNN